MSEARARIADRMVGELLEYLIGEVLPGADLSDPAWEAMAALGREVIEAIGRFDPGRGAGRDAAVAGSSSYSSPSRGTRTESHRSLAVVSLATGGPP